MNVDLYAHHYDRLNVNSVDMDDGVALDFSARKEGAIHAHVLIELDEASKRQLREVVRQWDRDDEARDRACDQCTDGLLDQGETCGHCNGTGVTPYVLVVPIDPMGSQRS